MRRVDRLWKILVSRLLTNRGRLETLRVVANRKRKKHSFYAIELPVGKVFVDGTNAGIDFQAFAQVLIDEIYSELSVLKRLVIDIGAHKGYFAAYALMSGAAGVLSYEPEEDNFNCLSRFAETANEKGYRVEVIQSAVSGTDGHATLYKSRDSWKHSILPSQSKQAYQTVQVASCSLETIVARAREVFPDAEIVLKIDAEGAECPLLMRTSAKTLVSVKEIIFESHFFADCKTTDIIDRLTGMGFKYRALADDTDVHHFRTA